MGSTAPVSWKTLVYYLIAIGAVIATGVAANLTSTQLAAASIFAGIIFGALFFWTYRLAFAFLGLAAMLALGVIDVKTIVAFAGLDIVLFLVGMMIVIGFLEERRFFEHIVDAVVDKVGDNGRLLVVVLMVMAAFSAALVDEVTSILFMAATVFNITTRLSVRPLPLLMMVVFATNVGSAATVVGNPVGVMIALRAGLTFSDFLQYATPVALACLALTIGICMFVFRTYIRELDTALLATEGSPVDSHSNTASLLWPGLLFGGVILALVLHTQIEKLLGLDKNAMLLGAALIGASIALIATGAHARELVERRVDWWTLSFFLALFASVGALQLTGVTGRIATGVLEASGGEGAPLFVMFTVVAAVLSAFMDNVLAVAMFIPVVSDLGLAGVDNFPLWWGMLFAGTLFGNLTMMGSTANIVAIGMLERRRLDQVSFLAWLKYGVLVAVPTMTLAIVLLLWRFY